MVNFFGLFKKEENKFVDYNIEYAHIYSDTAFNEEQVASVKKTKEIVKDLQKNKKTYSLVALIDDYHPEKIEFNRSKFIHDLKKLGLAPDYLVLESELVNYRQEVLNLLSNKESKKINKDLNKKEKLSCSFLLVGWYFLRLGLLGFKKQTLISTSGRNKPFYGKEIINVLDDKYLLTEDRAHRIIRKSVFSQNEGRIKSIFY